jgi:two-component system LytT family response regulator
MNALIIEDEIVAAQALEALVREVDPSIRIVATLQSIDESTEWFATAPPPDLVFMDIHLADGSSFGIFEQVDVPCPVVFTTAYDEYALKAFEVNSIDYLLKPINRKDLERAINKYRNSTARPDENIGLINKLLADLRQTSVAYRNCFLVPERDKLIPLPTADIAYVCIDAKVVKAVTFAGRTCYMDIPLDDLMTQLDPARFFRANRQFIIAHRAVRDLSLWFGGKLSVNLTVHAPERILVSKARVPDFKRWFTDLAREEMN